MGKDTSKLLEELKDFSSYKDFYKENQGNIESIDLGKYLEKIIAEKGLSKSEIVEKSEMSEVYTYQIISGIKKNPKREKVICIAIGMGLDFEETQTMLKKTGYAPLYAKNSFDAIVIYAIIKKLSVVELNNLLFEYGEETIG